MSQTIIHDGLVGMAYLEQYEVTFDSRTPGSSLGRRRRLEAIGLNHRSPASSLGAGAGTRDATRAWARVGANLQEVGA